MFKNKNQKNIIIVGFLMFLIGSILFWFFISKNTNTELDFLKPMYFVGIVIIPFYVILQKLSEKLKKVKDTKSKLKIISLFIAIATISYFLIVAILKSF